MATFTEEEPKFVRRIRLGDSIWARIGAAAVEMSRVLGIPVSRSAYVRKAIADRLEQDGFDDFEPDDEDER